MNVFIGGSRAVSKLNAVIRARIDDLIARECTILIGDANGADKAVQQYLDKRQYSQVVVFCMEECRNNVGAWPVRRIAPPNTRKDFSYYSAKDLAMSEEAKCGVMLWDGSSKGTLQNILTRLSL
jgi:adenine-specific DNA-methyltransferase